MSDIKFTPEGITVEGALGVNEFHPKRDLHVNGNEIHSGGSSGGFSFGERGKDFVEVPSAGERWVLYASNGEARLWSRFDRFSINSLGHIKAVSIETQSGIKPFHIEGTRHTNDPDTSDQDSIWLFAKDIMLRGRKWNPATKAFENYSADKEPRKNFALSHVEGDMLVVNRGGGYTGGVKIEGSVQIPGKLEVEGTDVKKELAALRAEIEQLKEMLKAKQSSALKNPDLKIDIDKLKGRLK
jgi:hypothetical protein